MRRNEFKLAIALHESELVRFDPNLLRIWFWSGGANPTINMCSVLGDIIDTRTMEGEVNLQRVRMEMASWQSELLGRPLKTDDEFEGKYL